MTSGTWPVASGNRRRSPVRVVAFLSLVACYLSLVSCGFHLRGAVQLPAAMARTQLTGTPARSALADDITAALELAGVQVVQDDAGAVLDITQEQSGRRLLSVDNLGRASEYELSYRLGYELRAPTPIDAAANPKLKPKVWVPAQVVTVTRDFVFDPNNVLSSGDEETQIRSEMRRSAVRQMLVRLQAQLRDKELK